MVFLSHEQVAIIAISCVLVIFYIAALSDESIYKTENAFGSVSYGMFKACLLTASQDYVPEGCYDYYSDYGKVVSNDCSIDDGGNTDMDFCNIRKAAASFISMSLILVLASIGLSALSVMELPYSSSAHGYSTLLQLLCFLFTMVGFSLLANLKLNYDDAKGRLNYDLDYGPTFYLIVLAWVMHILSLLLHVLVDPGEGAPVVPLGQMRMLGSVEASAFQKPGSPNPFSNPANDDLFDDDDDDDQQYDSPPASRTASTHDVNVDPINAIFKKQSQSHSISSQSVNTVGPAVTYNPLTGMQGLRSGSNSSLNNAGATDSSSGMKHNPLTSGSIISLNKNSMPSPVMPSRAAESRPLGGGVMPGRAPSLGGGVMPRRAPSITNPLGGGVMPGRAPSQSFK